MDVFRSRVQFARVGGRSAMRNHDRLSMICCQSSQGEGPAPSGVRSSYKLRTPTATSGGVDCAMNGLVQRNKSLFDHLTSVAWRKRVLDKNECDCKTAFA